MNNNPPDNEADNDYEIFGAAPAAAQEGFQMPEREEGESGEDYKNRLREWLDEQEGGKK